MPRQVRLFIFAGLIALCGCRNHTYVVTITPASVSVAPGAAVSLTSKVIYDGSPGAVTVDLAGAGGCGDIKPTTGITSNDTGDLPTTFTAGHPTANCVETVTATTAGGTASSIITVTVPPPTATQPMTTPGPTGRAVGSINVAVTYAPGAGNTPPTWTYVVTESGAAGTLATFDHIIVDTSVPCSVKSSAASANLPGGAPKHSLLTYDPGVATDTFVLSCADARAGGGTTITVLDNSPARKGATTGPISVAGPQA